MKKKKNMYYTIATRVLALIACLLILLGLAIARDGKVWGMSAKADESSKSVAKADTATVTTLDDGTVVVNTTSLTRNVQGYAGPTPMKVYFKDGRIDSLEMLKNVETPEFLEAVVSEILPQYKGKTVAEASSMKVDAVSGATFSSNAVKANVSAALRTVAAVKQTEDENPLKAWFNGLAEGKGWGELAAVIVSLLAAVLPLFIKNRTYRLVQQVLNVAVLGFWAGTFVNYSSMVGYMSNGINLTKSLAMVILLIVAFLYPLFGKKNYYCTCCCPLGSAQDLAFRLKGDKISALRKAMAPSSKTQRMLRRFRVALWAVLMLLSWLGVTFAWMDYELFTAFIWQSASWVVIALCVVTLVISIFVPRPYCRFVCPTGTLLKML